MKVLLIKDVYKLGRAGDVKKVADGFGRNFLLPQGFAVLATLGALKQADKIRAQASVRRTQLNSELGGLSDKVNGTVLVFASKAGETGKLYGSITNQMIAEALNSKLDTEIDRRAVEIQPVRTLGEHKAKIRLTMDLVPEIKIIVHREGESVKETVAPAAKEPAAAVETVETVEAVEPAPAAE
jgi:large subunit ribosomal protein L9